MNRNGDPEPEVAPGTLSQQVRRKAIRKLRARRRGTPGVWLGLGMMGLIGWSIVVPTLVGAATGIWLDRRFPGRHSWTLALLVLGLALGCLNAWNWVARENSEMNEEQND